MFSGLDRRKLISPEKIVAGKAHQLNVKRVIHNNNVPSRNVDSAYALIETHGFKIHAEDLGGNAHRQLFFDIWSGDAWVRKPGATLI